MTKEILIVGVGSFAGGALRYILSVWLSKLGRLWAFPIGIMVINILGCFLIGVLYGYFKSKATTDPVLPLLLMTGVLGGFTTFSTFSFETVQLLQQNEWLKAALYVVGSVGLGVVACYLGMRQFGN
ncbi:CrcB protein [Capnocytophaga leadbetteri]|uniref:Fluoride-specific ion channel FluC n=1 Tax=Capnocytophaga leadbetteri TaxID=327575 RepID=A0A2T5XSB2_9FLAO|nr:fluoride efflux transporter CrcB [Capnocytophaga leadbetteri]PTX02625.1 CrcB protein [Capnocytophaga leadbetteri]